jgi:hypothetical protein
MRIYKDRTGMASGGERGWDKENGLNSKYSQFNTPAGLFEPKIFTCYGHQKLIRKGFA